MSILYNKDNPETAKDSLYHAIRIVGGTIMAHETKGIDGTVKDPETRKQEAAIGVEDLDTSNKTATKNGWAIPKFRWHTWGRKLLSLCSQMNSKHTRSLH